MSFARRCVLIALVFVACVSCDQITKMIASSVLTESELWSFWGDTVRLQLTSNPGGFLGLGSLLPEPLRESIFTVGVSFLLLGVLLYALFAKVGGSEVFAVALIFSGGVGNLIDRVLYNGSVVDFINIGIGPVRTGIFNVADVVITAGVCIALLAALRRNGNKGS